MATVQAQAALRMDTIQLSDIWFNTLTIADNFHIQVSASPSEHTDFYGFFQYDAAGTTIVGGTLNEIDYTFNNQVAWKISDLSISAVTFYDWVVADATSTAMTTMFAGADSITGSSFDDKLEGFAGGDVISGGAGNDELYGDDGDDRIEGGAGSDLLNGGSGSDTASYAGAASGVKVQIGFAGAQDTLGAGADTLVSIENLIGSGYADTLTGDAGDNVLTGGSGDDILSGGAGNDTLDGGFGIDTATYAQAPSGVTVNTILVDAQSTGGAGVDTLYDVENLVGSAFNDVLSGANGTLTGGAGDDVLVSWGGESRLDGGSGTDTADLKMYDQGIVL
ncbi:MAG: calcium-binding protein, partial [Phenylobacterium sp.]